MPRPLRIVALGGGTGLPLILRGLRDLATSGGAAADRVDLDRVSAVVTVSDDGGSSGRLVRDFHTLPPGDIRNCLLALADEQEAPLIQKFLGYRFAADGGDELAGHSVGNILLTALYRLNGNDFPRAVYDVARILNLRGRILLPTLEPSVLVARLDDGTEIRGESRIGLRWNPSPIDEVYLAHADADRTGPFEPGPEVVEAIDQAHVVLLGPGSLFTSVVPAFLVEGVRDAVVRASRRVPVCYICNVMTEAGETEGFSAGDHVRALLRHAPGLELARCVANRQTIAEPYLRQYAIARLLLGYRTVRLALDEVLQRDAAHRPCFDELVEHADAHARRLRRLSQELRQVQAERIQVRVDPERDADLLPLIEEIDCVSEVEIHDERGQRKVIRHDAGPVLAAALAGL
jgi:uncharacterized cofD-like protein